MLRSSNGSGLGSLVKYELLIRNGTHCGASITVKGQSRRERQHHKGQQPVNILRGSRHVLELVPEVQNDLEFNITYEDAGLKPALRGERDQQKSPDNACHISCVLPSKDSTTIRASASIQTACVYAHAPIRYPEH